MICIKCGRDKKDTDFFKDKNSIRMNICKSCLCMHIDNRKPETFKWILQKFDVPYIEKRWVMMTNKAYLKSPATFGPQSVIGTYLRTMNMAQFRDYTYADSDMLNQETLNLQRAAKKQRAELGKDDASENDELRRKYENGEISKAEYETLRTDTDEISKSKQDEHAESYADLAQEKMKDEEKLSNLEETDEVKYAKAVKVKIEELKEAEMKGHRQKAKMVERELAYYKRKMAGIVTPEEEFAEIAEQIAEKASVIQEAKKHNWPQDEIDKMEQELADMKKQLMPPEEGSEESQTQEQEAIDESSSEGIEALKEQIAALTSKMENMNNSSSLLDNEEQEDILDIPAMNDDGTQFIPDAAQVNEDHIREELTADDITYLSLKWGLLYKPSEWVELERLYQKYAADYELSVDREQSLKAICKTDLKMNQAIDVGDVKTFKDLQVANDSLRKSAKFTDAQKQEQKKRELDSIGELVAFVEKEGGIIPMKDDPIEAPQDKIDFIIQDLKRYTSNLVKNELGLGNLIESFIEKTKENKAQSAEDIMRQGIKSDDENVITQDEAEQFQQFQLEEREEEAKRLAEEYGAE